MGWSGDVDFGTAAPGDDVAVPRSERSEVLGSFTDREPGCMAKAYQCARVKAIYYFRQGVKGVCEEKWGISPLAGAGRARKCRGR